MDSFCLEFCNKVTKFVKKCK